MASLVQAMKDRIEESAEKDGSESIGQILEDFISKGYSKDEVMKAFGIVSEMFDNGEYD